MLKDNRPAYPKWAEGFDADWSEREQQWVVLFIGRKQAAEALATMQSLYPPAAGLAMAPLPRDTDVDTSIRSAWYVGVADNA